MSESALYLDNAATSFPKPRAVYDAMVRYGTEVGASPGRGQYRASREGASIIRRCRERLATLLNAEDPGHIVFTLNTTDALNLAIKGVWRQWRLTRPGSPARIVTTAMDHNSVLRPLDALGAEGLEVVVVPADPVSGLVNPAAVARAIDGRTALVAVNMASNVGGTIQPVAEIALCCQAAGVPILVDAAQALGHLTVDVRVIGADFVAFPGHKGLLGPQGTGGLYVRPASASLLATTREGGTGSWSESRSQPESMPERFEAGSHNTVGIAGLGEAVQWVLDRGVGALRAHELSLIRLMLEGLRAGGCRHPGWEADGAGPLCGFRLLGPAEAERRVGVFGLVHDVLSPPEVAAGLESGFGVLARAGLTCAPLAHETFGSAAGGGACRLSIGPFVTEPDIERALTAIGKVGLSASGFARKTGHAVA
ncbi:MAG: aminotransferase class V-fold PLP-dependent enzyme [Phycisphaerales bacterium]|nr:aminotransferase class V-fold PLP-dependent enzyme [Phycisphaerales bacterium]